MGVFVLWKALTLLPLLPVAIPAFGIYSVLLTLNQAHLAFVGYLHLHEVLFWGTKFFTLLVLLPFGPLIHFFVYPPLAILALINKAIMAVVIFFTFPLAYLVFLWHDFHKLHQHVVALVLIGLKLLNL